MDVSAALTENCKPLGLPLGLASCSPAQWNTFKELLVKNDSQTCQRIKMSLSARCKIYTRAPKPKNSIISRVKSWPYTIYLSILSHLQSGRLQAESENPKKSSWCNCCCNRKRWTALKIHPLPWCQGKWDLAGHAGSPYVWYSTPFQRAAHTDSLHVKYTSQLSFQRDGWLVCKRIYSRRNWVFRRILFYFFSHPTWCFRSQLLMCIWVNRLGSWVEFL